MTCGAFCRHRKGLEQAQAEMPVTFPAAGSPALVLPLLHISWYFPVVSPANFQVLSSDPSTAALWRSPPTRTCFKGFFFAVQSTRSVFGVIEGTRPRGLAAAGPAATLAATLLLLP